MPAAGLTGYFFAPPSRQGPPSPLLADNIDPKTRDFADLFVGMDPIDSQVIVALQTTRGSGPCVLDTGIKLSRRKITEDFESATLSDARQALGRLIRNRDIQVVGLETDQANEGAQQAQLNVAYRNLRALDPRTRYQPLTPMAQR